MTTLALWRVRAQLLLLRGALGQGDPLESWLERHPVLHAVLDEAASLGLVDFTLDEGLRRIDQQLGEHASPATVRPWSQQAPLTRLQRALKLDADALSAWVAIALPDEDPRLCAFIDELHGQSGRVTRATLVRCLGHLPTAGALQTLQHAGLIRQAAATAWSVPPSLWGLACGLTPSPAAWAHRPLAQLTPWQDLVLPDELLSPLRQAMSPGQGSSASAARAWLLRGTGGSGRHSLAGALAQAQGLGLLEAIDADQQPSMGAAAALLGAMPLFSIGLAPGERQAWTPPPGCPADIALRLPRHGGIAIEGRQPITLALSSPDADERRRHWHLALGGTEPDDTLVSLRLPRGTLHRCAQGLARPLGDATSVAKQVQARLDEDGRFALDGIAHRMPPLHLHESLALPAQVQDEFDTLVTRCRHRDLLAAALPAAMGHGSGVRALFKGPSGTGKTLAARQLAHALGRPLYRVDLAATVSKYIGETERNLERVFEAAESLDVVLLLDEGDALMAGRTQVSNATDRYANLETNYLLQRLEQHQGVLVVTTNAADRIDGAFARRMDVTLDFPLPDALTRLCLWQSHLADAADVADDALERIALRCVLSGGQIRNAALHAALLAIDQARRIETRDLLLALEREYRKAGQQCPSLDEVG